MSKYEINFTSGGGGGADEVAVDPTEPTSPDILLWVDTDQDGTSTFRNIVSSTEPEGFVGDNWVRPLTNLVLDGYLTNTAKWRLDYGFGYATAVATPGTGVMGLSNASTTAKAMTRPSTIYSDCATGDFCYVEIDVTNIVGQVRATQAFTRSGAWSVGTGPQTLSLYASWVNQDFGLELDTESSADVSAVRFYNVSKHPTLLHAYNVDNTWTPLTAPQNYKDRNRIINGDFSVNQRGFTSLTTNNFGFDRWKMFASGGTYTYSAETATLGELPESAASFARLVSSGQSAASDFTLLRNKIEDVRTLSGKTVTVSFWAKASTGTPKVAIDFAQAFGTGGSPSTWVGTYAGQATLSTTWTRYSMTVTLPSIAGKTLGTDGNDCLELSVWTSAGSSQDARTGSLGLQNATIDLWGVQVEEGPIATPFEVVPYAEQLRACRRYYYRPNSATPYNKYGTGIVNSTTAAVIAIPLYVPMRAAPTVSYSGSLRVYDTSAAGAVTGITGDSITSDHVSLSCTASGGGLTIARPAILMNNNSTTAYIELSAEL